MIILITLDLEHYRITHIILPFSFTHSYNILSSFNNSSLKFEYMATQP